MRIWIATARFYGLVMTKNFGGGRPLLTPTAAPQIFIDGSANGLSWFGLFLSLRATLPLLNGLIFPKAPEVMVPPSSSLLLSFSTSYTFQHPSISRPPENSRGPNLCMPAVACHVTEQDLAMMCASTRTKLLSLTGKNGRGGNLCLFGLVRTPHA